MTVFEFVSVHRSILYYLAANRITADDVTDRLYYEEYRKLRPAIKEEAAARMVAERHNMDPGRMIRIVRRMETEITILQTD